MPIESITEKLRTNIPVAPDGGLAGAAAQTGAAQTAQVLGGASVTVSAAPSTDLEKLVARVKQESDQTRNAVAQRRIAVLLTILNSMNERISEQQRNNLVKIEQLRGDLDDIAKAIVEMQNAKSTAQAASAVMAEKIKALEKAVEGAVEDGKAHRETIEKLKAQKEEQDAKVRELENSIASASAKAAGIKADMAACEAAIGAATLGEVAAAVRAAAGEVRAPEESESQTDRDKAEKKAAETNPLDAIREALDKMDADIMRTIEESQTIKA